MNFFNFFRRKKKIKDTTCVTQSENVVSRCDLFELDLKGNSNLVAADLYFVTAMQYAREGVESASVRSWVYGVLLQAVRCYLRFLISKTGAVPKMTVSLPVLAKQAQDCGVLPVTESVLQLLMLFDSRETLYAWTGCENITQERFKVLENAACDLHYTTR